MHHLANLRSDLVCEPQDSRRNTRRRGLHWAWRSWGWSSGRAWPQSGLSAPTAGSHCIGNHWMEQYLSAAFAGKTLWKMSWVFADWVEHRFDYFNILQHVIILHGVTVKTSTAVQTWPNLSNTFIYNCGALQVRAQDTSYQYWQQYCCISNTKCFLIPPWLTFPRFVRAPRPQWRVLCRRARRRPPASWAGHPWCSTAAWSPTSGGTERVHRGQRGGQCSLRRNETHRLRCFPLPWRSPSGSGSPQSSPAARPAPAPPSGPRRWRRCVAAACRGCWRPCRPGRSAWRPGWTAGSEWSYRTWGEAAVTSDSLQDFKKFTFTSIRNFNEPCCCVS